MRMYFPRFTACTFINFPNKYAKQFLIGTTIAYTESAVYDPVDIHELFSHLSTAIFFV